MILMGYSAATAASVAGSMAMLFGGTGAGLAGYKMIKRTRGLSDFEFQSFDAKVFPLGMCDSCTSRQLGVLYVHWCAVS